MSAPRRHWLLDLFFELALLAYPRAFRRRFGAEMRDLFRLGRGAPFLNLIWNGLAERGAAVHRWLFWPRHQSHLYEPSGRREMLWHDFWSDARHTLRQARRAPVYTALAILALALGIGANSAIFTVVKAVLIQPLPYRDPGALVSVWSKNAKENRPFNPVSPANFLDYRVGVKDLARLEGFFSFLISNQMRSGEAPERVVTAVVGTGMFDLLGTKPILGRTFAAGDVNAIVLSNGFWRRRFGGDPAVIGRQLNVGETIRTVIGVMPAGFVFPYQTMLGPDGFTRLTNVEMWMPWEPATDPFSNRGGLIVRNVHFLGVIGRLHPGARVETLRARLDTLAARLEQAHPADAAGWGATLAPLHEQAVGSVRPALLVLWAGVGVVLLMAAVNVANLALARSVARRHELAVRAALGAGRGRLIRQALTESVVLSLGGATVALLFVRWGVRALVALAPVSLPRIGEVRPDWAVLAFTLAAGVAVGILVGLVPALSASRTNVSGALHEAGCRTAGWSSGGRRLRASLVVGEISLAVLLATGTGLLLRSFSLLLAVDPGFQSEGLLTMQIELPARIAGADARIAYYQQFFDRLRAIPGVLAAGGSTRLPLGSTAVSTSIDVEGRPLPPGQMPEVQFRRAVDDYFGAMRIPVLRGRAFTPDDSPSSQRVCVINQTLAARLFPGENPLGRRIRTGPNPAQNPWITIVGVIGDVRHMRLDETPAPELYICHRQGPPVAPFIVLRTSTDPGVMADVVRAELRQFDRTLALYDIRTMTEVRTEAVSERRFLLVLLGVFGLLSLTLAAVGVYGVMALVVGERAREMGLRLALGARPASLLRLILTQAAQLGALGVALGSLLAWLLAPVLAGQLYGVGPGDPITFAAVPALLLLVALAAAFVPALRATRVDPLTALRDE